MKISSVDYTTFWSLVSSKNLVPQYTDQDYYYNIFAIEDNISWETSVLKDGSDPNQTDFETNHLSSCNQPLEFRSKDGLLKVASSMFTDNVSFWVDGSQGYLQISAGQTAYSITNFLSSYKLNGVDMQWANANAGDYVNFDVGFYTNNDTTDQTQFNQIAQFANQYRLYGSAEKSFILDTVSTIPPTYNGLNIYIRTTYVNTGANNAMLFINLLGYK